MNDLAVDAPGRQRRRLNTAGSGDKVGAEVMHGFQFLVQHIGIGNAEQRIEIDIQTTRIEHVAARPAGIEKIDKLFFRGIQSRMPGCHVDTDVVVQFMHIGRIITHRLETGTLDIDAITDF